MSKPFSLFTSLFLLLLAACTPASPTAEAASLRVQYTFAAQPWLADVYACAGENIVRADLRAADFLDPASADLVIRIGESSPLLHPAYQIDTEEILVIVHPENPVSRLNADEVRALFTGAVTNWQEVGGADAPVQVWVFAAGEDMQQIFEAEALGGAPVVSTARLASGPEAMAQAVAEDVNAVGILTRSLLTADVEAVYTAAAVPVLVILPAEPEGAVASLLACLQK